MRDILFRAKSNKTGKWLEGLLTKDQEGHFRIQFDPARFSEIVISETVGQFTGITDKNGNNIFEGDIIKYQVFSNWKKKCGLDDARNIGIVFYNTDKASFYIRMVKKVFVSDYYYIGENDPLSITCALWGLEIIGNIYDNPELLK
jgi:uncharacterized phage protein (TIGR01671 family)